MTGLLSLRTHDGSIHGNGLRASRVTAESSDGGIDLRFAAAPARVQVRSHDGSIGVHVPHDGTSYRVTSDVSDGHQDVSVPTDPGAVRHIDVKASDGSITVDTITVSGADQGNADVAVGASRSSCRPRSCASSGGAHVGCPVRVRLQPCHRICVLLCVLEGSQPDESVLPGAHRERREVVVGRLRAQRRHGDAQQSFEQRSDQLGEPPDHLVVAGSHQVHGHRDAAGPGGRRTC